MAFRKLKLFEIFDETSNFLANDIIEVDKSKVNEVFSTLYSPGLSYQGIFAFGIRDFVHVTDSVFELFGEDAATFNIESLLDRIHPDDVEYFLKVKKITAYFFFKFIDKELITEYKLSFQFRMKNAKGEYRQILHQAAPLALDADMNLSSVLISQSDITHITTENKYRFSFISIKGDYSYYNLKSISDLSVMAKARVNLLSDRELEILKYLSSGLSTTEVADALLISPTTVRTHRNNILKKTSFKTISQAIAYFIREGLI